MKKTRRFAAIAAAAMMTAALAVPMMSMNALAADAPTGRVTIVAEAKASEKHNLGLYQIFEVSKNGDSVIVDGWGDGVNVDDLITTLKADATIGSNFTEDSYAGAAGAQAVADILSTFNSDTAEAEAFARAAAKNVKGDPIYATSKEVDGQDSTKENLVFQGVPYGYYVAVNTEAVANPNNTDYTSYTLGVLRVVSGETTTGRTKIDFPSFDKQIGDINDSASPATVTYNEAADHDMGDQVPFRLVATIPSNVAKYDTYKMIFHDNLQADVFSLKAESIKLTYYTSISSLNSGDTGIELTIPEGAISTSVSSTKWQTTNEEGTPVIDSTIGDAKEDFSVTLDDIKKLTKKEGATGEFSGIVGGGVIVVDYTAQLTEDAKMGATGNWNGAYLEYSNNPNVSGSGDTDNTADSPKDYVVAFTYQTVVNKTNGTTGADLAGAEFMLYKKLTTPPEGAVAYQKLSTPTDGSDPVDETPEGLKGYYLVTEAVKSNNDAQFVFNGLDDGDYLLVESTVPDGFNGIEPVQFSIAATETQTDGFEALASLSGTGIFANSEGKVFELVAEKTEGEVITPAHYARPEGEEGVANGSLHATIENFKGSELPSTGGIGTTLFYVVGGVLVVGAGVTLITKKRIGKDAE